MIHILPSELPLGLAVLPDEGDGDAPLEGAGLQEGLLLLPLGPGELPLGLGEPLLGLGELLPELLLPPELLLLLLEDSYMGRHHRPLLSLGP